MNNGLRTAVLELQNRVARSAVQKHLDAQPELKKLNRLRNIANSAVWHELRADIMNMIDQCEGELHSTTDVNSLLNARGGSNALMHLVNWIDGADQRHRDIVSRLAEETQDTAALGDMGSSTADK